MNNKTLFEKKKTTEKNNESIERISIYKKMIATEKSLSKINCEELNFHSLCGDEDKTIQEILQYFIACKNKDLLIVKYLYFIL